MTDLESLALLIADLNAQVRALQQENAALREQVEQQPLTCPDCATPAGYPCADGCDRARCGACGGQRIACDCTRVTAGTMSDPDPAQHGEARVMNC